MDNVPLQLILFGLVDRVLEPFCYGCAGYLLSYRFSKSISGKIAAMLLTSLLFLWMDAVWPAIGFRSASLAMA